MPCDSPGGELLAGENPQDGLQRILSRMLGPLDGRVVNWDVKDLLGRWHRPAFDAHMVRGKETLRLSHTLFVLLLFCGLSFPTALPM